jgi:antitoxin (DNA-binding transcriptional repressor) of toxin-antitoxin stability system
MSTYTLADAKAKFSQVVAEVESGDSAVITKHGRPVALMTRPDDSAPKKRGINGFLKEKFEGWKMPDDFDRIGNAEITALFEGVEE